MKKPKLIRGTLVIALATAIIAVQAGPLHTDASIITPPRTVTFSGPLDSSEFAR